MHKMPARDVTRQTGAELMRFCTVTARTLTTISRRIAAGAEPAPGLEASFDDLTARLTAALAELDSRHSGPHPGPRGTKIKGTPND